jgi:hypothetical protein
MTGQLAFPGTDYIGRPHRDGCLCGCERVVGLRGEIVQDSDTPKLAKFGLVYVRFMVPQTNGGARERVVCYSRLDLADPAAREAGGL